MCACTTEAGMPARGRLFAETLVLAALSLPARADEALAALAPLRSGQADLELGLGGGFAAKRGAFELLPNAILSARAGVSDNLELALPGLVTISWRLPILPLEPRVALGGGATALGYASSEGLFVIPGANASVHFSHGASAAFFEAGGFTGAIGGKFQDTSTTTFLASGWALAVTPRLTFGVAAEASTLLIDSLGEGRSRATVTVGSSTFGPHSQTPLVRFQLLGECYLDGWFAVSVTRNLAPPSPPDVIATFLGSVGVTWAPQW